MKQIGKFVGAMLIALAMMLGTAMLTVWLMAKRGLVLPASSQRAPSESTPVQNPATQPVAAPQSESVVSPDGDLNWSREEIQQLREQTSNPTVHVLLELLRERSGGPVNYQELTERTGRTIPQVRADMSVFSRSARRIEGHDQWPIEKTDSTDGSSYLAYQVPKPYLDWWFDGK